MIIISIRNVLIRDRIVSIGYVERETDRERETDGQTQRQRQREMNLLLI